MRRILLATAITLAAAGAAEAECRFGTYGTAGAFPSAPPAMTYAGGAPLGGFAPQGGHLTPDGAPLMAVPQTPSDTPSDTPMYEASAEPQDEIIATHDPYTVSARSPMGVSVK
ncbi:MAG: hypothetical protein KDI98_07075 [Hyphomicrobiaceae bacterium]|nr:hypothetical protein [Hyphomicrobiaceae bacterium]